MYNSVKTSPFSVLQFNDEKNNHVYNKLVFYFDNLWFLGLEEPYMVFYFLHHFQKQGRTHGYHSRVRVGRGYI